MYKPTGSTRPNIWSELGLPSRGQALSQAVKDGVEISVLEQLAALMCVEPSKLAQHLAISASTFRRRMVQGRLSGNESDRLVRAISVLDAAMNVFEGDVGAAGAWMNAPAKGLAGTPLSLLGTSVGTGIVLDLLGQLEHGVFA